MATGLVFAAFGIVVGTWSARLPAVAHGVGADHGELGIALVCLAAGCVLGMVVLGRCVDRARSGVLMPVAVLLLGVVLPLTAVVSSLPALCAVLVLVGLVQGTCNVTMNAHGAALQRTLGRPVLGGLHARFSIGGFVGAGIGGAVAGFGGGAGVTFLVAALACALAACAGWARRWSPTPADRRGSGAVVRDGHVPPVRIVVLLGALALAAMVAEGAVGDWGAVYLRDALGAPASVAALAYSAFAVAMTGTRLVVDRVGARAGPVRTVRWSAVVAIGALVLAVSGGSPVLALVGFAGLGVGLAAIVPTVYGAVGASARLMSVVVGTGYVGFLCGPAVIGFVSTLTGLRIALLVPAALLVAVVAGARVLRQDHTTTPMRSDPVSP
ncbi:MFS transporter [Curtobacterium sp. PhB130]|uniref:MFS transporter n=1 Tax=Curtobacterium sp. PhB130 TaxID=2485178 RepID=UPI00160D061E|nr:MFS transporter [Curtobacterium sp. PhB130]